MDVGLGAIPGFGAVESAGIQLAVQAAQVMAWTFSDKNRASKHYGDWVQNPSGDGSKPTNEQEQPPAGVMEPTCGTKYSRTEADEIFDKFQLAVDFASAPKLFRGAANSWPPSFDRAKANWTTLLTLSKILTNRRVMIRTKSLLPSRDRLEWYGHCHKRERGQFDLQNSSVLFLLRLRRSSAGLVSTIGEY